MKTIRYLMLVVPKQYNTTNEQGGGGGLCLWDSSTSVLDCTFVDNTGLGGGGALRCKAPATGGTDLIRNCSFSGNSTPAFGGAVTVVKASPTFEFCSFDSNLAGTFGGGHQSGALFAGLGGTMDQINIILPTPPDCSGDFNGDNSVDITDLLSLIAAWGTCESCPEDVNTDGAVDVSDLLALIAAWGPC